MAVGAESPVRVNTPILLTSSDPSRLLLAADAKSAGQASITLNAATGLQFWAQALGDSGTVTLTATADGYQPGSQTVDLAPSAAVFTSGQNTLTMFTNSGPQP